MDLFDDILPGAPAARARPGGKFMPKVKSKQLPRKETFAPEQATSSKDGENMPVVPSSTSKDSQGISQNECHNAVAVSTATEELPILEDTTNYKMDNPQQVSVNKDTEVLADDLPFTAAVSEVDAAQSFANLPKSASEADPIGFEGGSVTNIILENDLNNAHKFQPKIKPRPRVGNTPAIASASSSVMMEKSVELPTCTSEVQSFQSSGRLNQSTSVPSSSSEILRTTDLSNKIDYMSSIIPFSEDNRSLSAVITSQPDSLNAMLPEVVLHNGTRDWPSSFGKSVTETADIFSGLESLDDFLTQAATSTGKPAPNSFSKKPTEENFAIPACSFVNSFGACDTTQVQRCPKYHTITTQDSLTFNEAEVLNEDDTCTNNRRSETEEVADFNPDCLIDNVFDYQSMKSGTDPSSEIPMHEELTNATDSPTLADFLHQGVTGEKENANERKKSLRKHRRSSIASEGNKGGKTSRRLREQGTRKPANNSLDEDDDDLDPPYNSNRDELEENDDEYEEDHSSKKKRAPTSSKKKSVAKNGKIAQKCRSDNDDSEKTTKKPSKKFSHSTRRKKRCVDKALLEIPEDELDPRTLRMKDIILLAEYRERSAKKEASTSKTFSTNQSSGDFHHETGTNNEEEIFGSEDYRDPGDDDEASETITSTSSLFNYQSFMDKAPRGKWSKQDTELFYEAVGQFGTDFSMIQQLFPDKTRHQVKLKYKKEERQHPIRLSDAVNNPSTGYSHFKLLIERLQQASTKVEQEPSRDASDFMPGEEEDEVVEDLTPGTNEEAATTKQDEANVKDQEDTVAFISPEQSEDSDDDLQRWSQYKSDY